jgi:transcriptional regulator with XRE-family HTH domain
MLILTDMFIGKNLRLLRKNAGLTQAELAKALKVRQQVVASYEKCLSNPEVAKLPTLAKTLKVDVTEFFREGERVEDPKVKVRRTNSREVRAQEAFRSLKPEEQRVIISHMNALLRATKQRQQERVPAA